MSEMTLREAAQILSAVSQQYRASKMLEEALQVAIAAEGQITISENRKGELEGQVANLSERLIDLGNQIEKEEAKLATNLRDSSNLIADAKARVRAEETKTEEAIKFNKEEVERQLKALNDEYDINRKQVEGVMTIREERLVEINKSIQIAEGEIASVRERLG